MDYILLLYDCLSESSLLWKDPHLIYLFIFRDGCILVC
jgi:hypothetical protein